jgi:tetratricopeptide (TPR) repeat protein
VIKAILACFLAVTCALASWSQVSAPSQPDLQTHAVTPPPYDRLELLASIAASMSSPYLLSEFRARGIDFIADQGFLDAILKWHAKVELIGAVENAKPRTKHTPSADREKAYSILADLGGSNRDPSAGGKFQLAIALAPNSPALHIAYAEHLLLVPDYPAAEVEARRSIELWPGDADAHVLLATALTGQFRDDEAIPEAREALHIFPEHKAALIELSMALSRDHQFKEAIPLLREAMSGTPKMALLHKYLGLSLFNTGNIEGSISEYVTFLEANPNDAEGHYELGVAFRAQGRKDDAQAQFREAARLDPANRLFANLADPSTERKSPEDSGGERPDDGAVDRNIYTNRFFGFSFQFPQNWTVLNVDDARAAAKLGGGMISGGDPTIQDAQQAAATHAYPLLFVIPGMGTSLSSRSIQIQALDSRLSPEIASGKDFLESSARLFRRMHTPLQPIGSPVEMSVDGRHLWRLDSIVQIDNKVHYASEIVMIQKGYLLLFVLSSPDEAGLEELVQCMKSLHFFEDAKSLLP